MSDFWNGYFLGSLNNNNGPKWFNLLLFGIFVGVMLFLIIGNIAIPKTEKGNAQVDKQKIISIIKLSYKEFLSPEDIAILKELEGEEQALMLNAKTSDVAHKIRLKYGEIYAEPLERTRENYRVWLNLPRHGSFARICKRGNKTTYVSNPYSEILHFLKHNQGNISLSLPDLYSCEKTIPQNK